LNNWHEWNVESDFAEMIKRIGRIPGSLTADYFAEIESNNELLDKKDELLKEIEEFESWKLKTR